MEWSILFLGSVGAGKTQAIRTASEIPVVSTDVDATDETALLKKQTTVAMDVGVIDLGGGDKVVLYGAPGQDRFDFMWEILLDQAQGLVLLVDHSAPDPLADLDRYMSRIGSMQGRRRLPLVVGITHADCAPHKTLSVYRKHLAATDDARDGAQVPAFRMDARSPRDVRAILLALTSIVELGERSTRKVAA